MINTEKLHHYLGHLSGGFLRAADTMGDGIVLDPDTIDRAQDLYWRIKEVTPFAPKRLLLNDVRDDPNDQIEVVPLSLFFDWDQMITSLCLLERRIATLIDCDGRCLVGVRPYVPRPDGRDRDLSPAITVVCCGEDYLALLILEVLHQ